MNKRGQELTIGGLVISILLFIGFCLLVVWAVGGSGENQVNDAVISGASYLIGLGIMFLLFIALVVVLAILVKNAR